MRPALISGFCGMKRPGVFLFPPRWDVSSSQGYPKVLNSPVPIYTPGVERDTVRVKCLAQEYNTVFPAGLEPGPLEP